ncbi:unnamed protein product, partial [Prorocentrum cordatum]
IAVGRGRRRRLQALGEATLSPGSPCRRPTKATPSPACPCSRRRREEASRCLRPRRRTPPPPPGAAATSTRPRRRWALQPAAPALPPRRQTARPAPDCRSPWACRSSRLRAQLRRPLHRRGRRAVRRGRRRRGHASAAIAGPEAFAAAGRSSRSRAVGHEPRTDRL